MQCYAVVQRYIDGKSNSAADHLPRCLITMRTLAVFKLSNQSQLIGHCSRKPQRERERERKEDGILHIHDRNFVRTGMRMRILDGVAHAGHRGLMTTVGRVRRSFSWHGLEADTREYIGK